MANTKRQHRIIRLLEDEQISSQSQLVERLAAEGFDATQATVSRDLDAIGAHKVRASNGRLFYAVPELPKNRFVSDEHIRRTFREFVVSIAVSGNLLVIHTPVGSAQIVASALDRASLPEILGTVGGDDTLVVVVSDPAAAPVLAERLSQLADL